jgi:hypothetical protein
MIMKFFNKFKITVITFVFCFLLLGVLWPNDELYAGTEEVTKADYEIFVNGKEVFSDSGFYEIDGNILAPIRSIAESMNLEAIWDSETRQIKFSLNDDMFICTLGNDKYIFNGIENDLPLPPMIVNDRTLMPIKVVVEAFGGTFKVEQPVDTMVKYTIASIPTVKGNSSDVQLGTVLIDIPNVYVISDNNSLLINLPNGIDLTNGFKDKTKVSVVQEVYEARQEADNDLLVSKIFLVIPEYVGSELNGLMGNIHNPNCSIKTAKIAKDGRALEIVFNGKKTLGAENNRGILFIYFDAVKISEYSGDINGMIISSPGTPFPDAVLTIGRVLSSQLDIIIPSIKIISEEANELDSLIIRATNPYSLQDGEKIYFDLPQGFTWNLDSTSIKGAWGFEGLNITFLDVVNEGRTMIIKMPDELGLINSAWRIDIENLKINISEILAPRGYVSINIHSDKASITSYELIVANYVKNYDSKQVLIINSPLQNTIVTPFKPTLELIFAIGINPRNHALNIVASSGKPKVNLPKTGDSFITPQMTISSAGGVQAEIPAGTIVTGPSGWDGLINLPIVSDTPTQNLGSNQFVIKVGLENGSLDFSEPIWLFAPGQGKKEVKVIRNGIINDVTHVLSNNTLAAAKEALTNGRVDAKYVDGNDLYIWTTRFSEFVFYTPASLSPGGGGGGGGATTPKGQRISTDGGTVSDMGVSIYVPANAIAKEIYVSIEKLGTISRLIPDQHELISEVYNITKDKKDDFIYPVTITLPFDKKKANKEEDTVSLYWYDEQAKVWEQLDNIIVDGVKGTVTGEVNHFTKFAVISKKNEQGILPEEPEIIVKDIKGHWAEKDIIKLVNKKAVSGYPDGNFLPEQPITRAEFAVTLVKAYGLPLSEGKIFKDSGNHWAKDYIATANAGNIISGYNDDSFGPEDQITREQMAVMINNAAKFDADGMSVIFTDNNDISEWAKNAVERVAGNKVINGYPDGTFKPKQSTTRAEAVTVIVKSLEF